MDLMLVGQRWRLETPRPCGAGERFCHFVVPTAGTPDLQIVFRDSEPLFWPDAPVFQNGELRLYRRDGVLWRETGVTTPVGCVAYRDGRVEGYLYPVFRPYYTSVMQYFSLLGTEYLLYRQGAWMLHCAFVRLNGKAVLFTGPSGVGKSTQAELWVRYAGGEIINGDRAAIRCVDGMWMAYGLPYAGSSRIYRNECAEIGAVVVLGKAEENRVYRLGGGAAFGALYQQTTINPWDEAFQRDAADYLQQLISTVPVYKLEATPDQRAVNCLKEELTWNPRA